MWYISGEFEREYCGTHEQRFQTKISKRSGAKRRISLHKPVKIILAYVAQNFIFMYISCISVIAYWNLKFLAGKTKHKGSGAELRGISLH